MAFPIPSHLPRKTNSKNVASEILSEIDGATSQTLSSSLATSWLTKLDESIRTTKEQIHARIHVDLPEFERQLASSKSVQARLKSLSSNVDNLHHALSDSETGVVPTLIGNLTKHAALAQEASDTSVKFGALFTYYNAKLQRLLEAAPVSLSRTKVLAELKREFHVVKSRVEDQLNDAYSRSISISAAGITIRSSIQVRQSDTVLPLPSVLSSISPTALAQNLTTLRRDLTTYLIDYVLKQPLSISTTFSQGDHALSHVPSPPNSENLTERLNNMSMVLDFLSTRLFSCMSESQLRPFMRSLCKPITTSVLNNLLIPHLPSSFHLLPAFLDLSKQAVSFEDRYIVGVLGNEKNDLPIQNWAGAIGGHYERQRRQQIHDRSRALILSASNPGSTFHVEVELSPDIKVPEVIPIQAGEDEAQEAGQEDAWGLDDPSPAAEPRTPLEDMPDDGWGFDDDIPEATELDPEVPNGETEPDPADAWGWNEGDNIDLDENIEETAWDDAWSEAPSTSSTSSNPRPAPAPSIVSPKAATRLEKLASKSKKLNGHSAPDTTELHQNSTTSAPASPQDPKRPLRLAVSVPRKKHMLEGIELITSHIFLSRTESGSAPGAMLLQSSASVLDLYRALSSMELGLGAASGDKGMRLSNDCLYLSSQVDRIEGSIPRNISIHVQDRLAECKHQLKILATSLYEDTIDRQRQSVEAILEDGSKGFLDTAEQDRYDECEAAVSQVLKEIRQVGHTWKRVLTKSKYYAAIGLVAEAALARILRDVLALPDIPEVESHRLSELCRILNALEGIFVEDPDQPSFVVAYVPSWLKYSYLSELLEANMADITYLFEEGALVDFDVEELARLVRALFADTPLRANTINRLLNGHPIPP
ncbi:hypothetical protein BD779DRAFT_1670573 [Infundibulicybe gibba]|nr:hypothetical protein BD779DRAFT_1670573 [Infundibulicybe gibba]